MWRNIKRRNVVRTLTKCMRDCNGEGGLESCAIVDRVQQRLQVLRPLSAIFHLCGRSAGSVNSIWCLFEMAHSHSRQLKLNSIRQSADLVLNKNDTKLLSSVKRLSLPSCARTRPNREAQFLGRLVGCLLCLFAASASSGTRVLHWIYVKCEPS